MGKRLGFVFLLASAFILSCHSAASSPSVSIVSRGAERDEYSITGHKIRLDVVTRHCLTDDNDESRGSIFVSSTIGKRRYQQFLTIPHGL
jgi:hypothetical protein